MADVKTQLLQQWGSINPEYLQGTLKQSGLTLDQLADQFARQAQAAGITDLSQLKLGTTTEKVMGPEATTDWGSPQELDVTRNYLTFGEGDQAKNIGYIGAGEGQQYLDDPDALNRILYPYAFKDQGTDSLGRLFGTAEGGGWTSGEVIKGPDGQLMIVPKWGESSNVDEVMKAIQVLSPVAFPGLSNVLGNIGAAATMGGTMGGLGAAASGENILKGIATGALKGGATAGIGQYAQQVLQPGIASLTSGMDPGLLKDITSSALSSAAKAGAGALVTGESIADAILAGAAGGATTAGLSGTLKDLLPKDTPQGALNVLTQTAVTAARGGDAEKAFFRSLLSEAMKPGGIKTMPGLGEYNFEALDPLELERLVTGDELLRELGLEDYDYSALNRDLGNLDDALVTGTDFDEDLWFDWPENASGTTNADLYTDILSQFPTGTGNLEQDFVVEQGREGPVIKDDAGNVGYFSNTGEWVPVTDVGAAPTGGNLEQDFSVVQGKDNAYLVDDAGNRGYFDDKGNWTVVTGEDPKELAKVMGDTTTTKTDTTKTDTKTDTKTTTDTSKSDMDLSALLALLGMMAGQGQQQPTQQYQLADVRGGLELAKALGLDLGSLYGSTKA